MNKKIEPYTIPVYRLQLVHEGDVEATAVRGPGDLAAHLKDIAQADREHVVCIHLDTKNRPIGRQVVSVGTLNASLVHPREVFKAALLANANAIAMVHNHPSGDLSPSRDDDDLTRNIARAGALLGIKLLDHVILAPDGSHFSYRDGGRVAELQPNE
ncbi:MAG: repair protein RadC [Candidatus Hydrogenedentes bacterium]|nr:repair protein RadC [Candidatus Hydrogenedentota bacterium]